MPYDIFDSWNPQTDKPLENNTIFPSMENALDYLTNHPMVIIGNEITVLENGEYKAYVIQPDKTLKAVGKEIDAYTKDETNQLLSQKEPSFTKNTAFNKNFGTTANTVCQGNDSRLDGYSKTEINNLLATKEPSFTKNTAFNKNFGTASGTVCQGNDSRLLSTSAEANKFVGTNASKALVTQNLDTTSITVDTSNVGLGINVANILKGTQNVAIGNNALSKNSSGYNNVAIGNGALQNSTDTRYSFALGSKALNANTTGVDNVAIGSDALLKNTTGEFNVAIGTGALSGATTGSNNIAIGYQANPSMLSYQNSIVIGNNVIPSGSNTITIGDTAHTTVKFGGSPNISINSSGYTFNGAVRVTASNLMVDNKTLLNFIYPVGSIYMSVNSTNPNSLFGGTWIAWGSGRVPVGINTSETEFNTVEKTGGAKTHTLATAEMPSHTHTATVSTDGVHNHGVNSGGTAATSTSGGSSYLVAGYSGNAYPTNMPFSIASGGSHSHTVTNSNSGSGTAHNNLQPYIVCYMFKRTA